LERILFPTMQGYSINNFRSFINSLRTFKGNNKGFLLWWGLFNKILVVKGKLLSCNKEKFVSTC
jgi:hypothetical protein